MRAAQAVFDDNEIIVTVISFLTIYKVEEDFTVVAALTLIIKCQFVISCIAEVADVFVTLGAICPTAITGG